MLRLNFKILLSLFLILVSVNLLADTNWEIGVLFLGKNEDSLFQKQIQSKISELKSVKKSPFLAINYLIETNNTERVDIENFFKKSFQQKYSKKMLLIYSHGEGPDGLKDFTPIELEEQILNLAPKLDILWFDSCFMSNLEFLYQINQYSKLTIASEDSEFSSGLNFTLLESLPALDHENAAAKFLASQFIHSYSYRNLGLYRRNVETSSATISVIENSKLKNFVDEMAKVKPIINKLTKKAQRMILKKLKEDYSMEKNELIDLGRLLIELRAKTYDVKDDFLLTKLIRLLNIKTIKSTQSNPRFQINVPNGNDIAMVYGYNNWQSADQDAYNQKSYLNSILKPDGFIQGPNQKSWPYIKIKRNSFYLSPFSPGLNELNYYFIDLKTGKKIGIEETLERKNDLYEIERIETDSPLLYSGYTQEIGINAEKYTGLSILSPDSIASIDYYESKFNEIVEWIEL